VTLVFKNNVQGASYNKDKSKLLIWTEHAIKIWDLTRKEYLFSTRGSDWILKAKFNTNENKILALYGHHGGYWRKNVKLWDINNSRKPLFTVGHNSQFINGASFSKDNTKILTWGYDGKVKLWSTENGKLLRVLKHRGRVSGVKFLKNQKILSWTGLNTNIENSNKSSIYLWDIKYQTKKPLFILKHHGIIENIKVSKNEKEFLSYGSDNIVKLWKVTTSESEQTEKFDIKKVNSLRNKTKENTINIEDLELKYDTEDIDNIVFDKKQEKVLFSLYTGKIMGTSKNNSQSHLKRSPIKF